MHPFRAVPALCALLISRLDGLDTMLSAHHTYVIDMLQPLLGALTSVTGELVLLFHNKDHSLQKTHRLGPKDVGKRSSARQCNG